MTHYKTYRQWHTTRHIDNFTDTMVIRTWGRPRDTRHMTHESIITSLWALIQVLSNNRYIWNCHNIFPPYYGNFIYTCFRLKPGSWHPKAQGAVPFRCGTCHFVVTFFVTRAFSLWHVPFLWLVSFVPFLGYVPFFVICSFVYLSKCTHCSFEYTVCLYVCICILSVCCFVCLSLFCLLACLCM